MRAVSLICAIAFASLSWSQTPDVSLGARLHGTWLVRGDQNLFRWYDAAGRPSTIELRLVLEPGYRMLVSQRLERYAGEADQDLLDEAYLEDPGLWRVGKQPLPFGLQATLNEKVMAVRGETRLLLDAAPISIAFADGGDGRQQGVFARGGREFGLSIARGSHIGIGSASLHPFRRAEESPGVGRGYELALGADYSISLGSVFVQAEWVSLRSGHTVHDRNRDLSQVKARLFTKGTRYEVNGTWARSWDLRRDWYVLEMVLPYSPSLSYAPYLRFEGTHWRDFGLTMRILL